MAHALIQPNLLCAWHGEAVLVVNTRGECGDDQTLSGFYFREARFLRTLRVLVEDDEPWLCEAAAAVLHRDVIGAAAALGLGVVAATGTARHLAARRKERGTADTAR